MIRRFTKVFYSVADFVDFYAIQRPNSFSHLSNKVVDKIIIIDMNGIKGCSVTNSYSILLLATNIHKYTFTTGAVC